MRRISNYIRHNLIALLALFFALGGGAAWAANTIGSADIIDGQVKTADIGDGEVKESDVGQGAVTSSELKNESIVASDVAPNALPTGRIADNSLTGTDVANNSLNGADIDESTLDVTGAQGEPGPPGEPGPAGPAGPPGVVLSGQAVALGNSPTGTTQFLTPAVQLTVASGQKVHLVANKAFGTLASPSNGLDLFPCYQSTGFASPIVTLGSGILNNAMPANSRITMGINHVIAGLTSGTYNFGMCGDDDGDGHWVNNDQGYVSAVVLNN